jgi:hypothetical protein
MRTKLSAVFGTVAAITILIALAFGLEMMLPPGERSVPGAPSGSYPTNAEEALWTYVEAAWDEELAHRTTSILQRQPWSEGEVILFTYEDTFPESAGGGRQHVLTWVLVEPDSGEAAWTIVAAGNKERVHWPLDRTMPTPEDVPVFTFWLSERKDGEGHPLSVIYGWDARLGDKPKAMRLTLDDRSTEIPMENDSFLYVAEESLTGKRPNISYDCDPPGGGRCCVAVYTDERPIRLSLPAFAGEIQSQNRAIDPLTGRFVPYTLGQSDPTDRFAPGRLFTPAEVHFSLHWQIVSSPSADWRVFVHLENEAGEVMLQSDVAVDWPTQPCTEETYDPEACTIVSEHYWEIPADFPLGLYTIKVGLYDPETGERAPMTGPAKTSSPVTLGQVRIVSTA